VRHVSLTEACGAFDERVEDRLQVERRAADQLENVRRGRLLFQRLACLCDESRILHSDDRLRGEVLQQRDLLVGERAHLLAVDHKYPEQCIVFAQRHRQLRASATHFYDCPAHWVS